MADSRAQRGTYFASLQALRAVAAIAVLLFHLRPIEERRLPGFPLLESLASHADAGVDLFFVISGFVMTTILHGRPGGLQAAVRFLSARAWRVLPLYWVFTTAVIVVMLIAPGMVNSSFPGQSVVASYLLIPHIQLPLLTVGWTLVHEAYFYLVVALAVGVFQGRSLTPFFVMWGILICIPHAMDAVIDSPWKRVITSPLTLEFIAGALLGLYWHRIPAQFGGYLAVLGIAVYAAATMLLPESYEPARDVWQRVACFGTASTLIVAGMVMLEAHSRISIPKWLGSLGDSSYSLYLSHIFVLSLIGRAWPHFAPSSSHLSHAAFLVFAVGASLLVARVVHNKLERPLLELPERLAGARQT
jgi:exopolysaccharide production protein ExoZ